MKKTIGILAHVDAGKTTFSEQLFYNVGMISKAGRVDHKDSFLDRDIIERKRGITIYLGQGYFKYNNSEYYIMDTPGHVDFSSEMERTLPILDYAVLVVSAVEGVQAHTETIWNYLQKHEIPTFIFINKMDRDGVQRQELIKNLEKNLKSKLINLGEINEKGELNQKIIEDIAELREQWLEDYLEDRKENDLWEDHLKIAIKERLIFPYMCGSALNNVGIEEFFRAFDRLTITDYSKEARFGGRVYKIKYDKNGIRWTYLKGYCGQAKLRDFLSYGNEGLDEKITEIMRVNGEYMEQINKIQAGDLVAIRGLSKTKIGQGVASIKDDIEYEIYPVLKTKVIFNENTDPKWAYKYFKILDEEDPSLQIYWNEEKSEIYIHTMGEIQLEVLSESFLERFKINIGFDEPEIIYKETIVGESIGVGHFEPLKHYAEVQLKIEQIDSECGVLFENKCHADDLSIGYQNLVKQHIFERRHRGVLTGSELTDVKITLLTGKSHNKHTEGGDFREATYRAIRQGLMEAKTRILEPYYRFKIKIPTDQIGRLIADLQALNAKSDIPIIGEEYAVIKGRVAVDKFRGYEKKLAIQTSGRGLINLKFDGYGDCERESEVIEKINYNPLVDMGHSPDSVFCSKGKQYKVLWQDVKKHMHTVLKS